MQSIQNFFIRSFLKVVVKKEKIAPAPIGAVRKSLAKLTSMALRAKGVTIEAVSCDGITAEWSHPNNLKTKGVILYLHGGGYVSGSIKTHRALVGNIATAAQTKCLSVEYALAPEVPFPQGLNDAVTVYSWLLKQGYDHSKIIIAGDSAGGGLAAGTLLKIRDEKMPKPAAGVLLSPWLDLECTGDSIKRLANKDVMIPEDALLKYGKLYANEHIKNPYASPILGNLQGLPPIYIQVSDAEILLDDTLRFKETALAAKVDIKVDVYKNTAHVWQAYGIMLPEANKAIKQIGAYIQKNL
jgi:epsilon-lactone hydrolase